MKSYNYLLIALGLLVILAAGMFWSGRQPEHRPIVVALVQLTEVDAATVISFKAGLEEAGYREGKEVLYLSSGPALEISKLDGIIRGHLAKHPDMIMVSSTPATQAVKRLTEGMHIPIVFAPVNDPVSAGIVINLKQPGGNITGIRLPTGDDLRLKWLIAIAPKVRKVFVPYTPGDKSSQTSMETISEAATKLGIKLLTRAVESGGDIKAVLAALPPGVDAIFLPRDSSIESHIEAFVAYANPRRLPISAPSYQQVKKGALMSYGFAHEDIGRQAARLAQQILKGTRPADLPVEMAESILSLNMATAERIGLRIPEETIQQAEKVVRE